MRQYHWAVSNMIDNLRTIDIQIYKEAEWISCHKTFNDKNVILRVYSIIREQFKENEIRVIDNNGDDVKINLITYKSKTRHLY